MKEQKKALILFLKKASLDGKVTIRKDNQLYVLMPASTTSPFDVEGVDMNITSKDILQSIHESRKL